MIVTFLEISKSKIKLILLLIPSDNLFCLYNIPIENNTIETIRKGIVSAPISNDSTSANGLVIEMTNAGKITETKLKSTIEIVQIKTIVGVLEVIPDPIKAL